MALNSYLIAFTDRFFGCKILVMLLNTATLTGTLLLAKEKSRIQIIVNILATYVAMYVHMLKILIATYLCSYVHIKVPNLCNYSNCVCMLACAHIHRSNFGDTITTNLYTPITQKMGMRH